MQSTCGFVFLLQTPMDIPSLHTLCFGCLAHRGEYFSSFYTQNRGLPITLQHPCSMLHIFFKGHPFKVLWTIIRLVAINVIHLRLVIWIGDKSHCHKSMDKNSSYCSVIPQQDGLVSLVGGVAKPSFVATASMNPDTSVIIYGNIRPIYGENFFHDSPQNGN